MRRSISSARSPTLCSRCNSAKVVSMCRIAMTLAKLVIMMTVSTSRNPPKVNCPIEKENERMRWAKLVNDIDDPGRLRTGRNIRPNRLDGEQRTSAPHLRAAQKGRRARRHGHGGDANDDTTEAQLLLR